MDDWGVEQEEAYGILAFEQDGVIQETKIPTIPGNYGKYYDNIHAALTDHAPLAVKPEETVDVLRIIEAAQQSNNEKRRIPL